MRRLTVDELEAEVGTGGGGGGGGGRSGASATGAASRDIEAAVRAIIDRVRAEGAPAVRDLRLRFDRGAARFPDLEVPREAWVRALAALDPGLRAALEGMVDRVRAFAEAERAALAATAIALEPAPGVHAAVRLRPIARVACYVPGGRHPLPSTAIMTALVAKVAGAADVTVLCPDPHPAVLAAALLASADRVLALGGAHGIAAVAFGAGAPRADLVCGPGGVYVAEAKRQLHGVIGTDLPAGPSEVLVLADASADVDLVLADLDAQAEHDPAARPLLATTSARLAEAALAHAAAGFAGRPNADALAGAYAAHGLAIDCATRADLARAANLLAPEHLALHVEAPGRLLDAIDHFGAAFVGGRAAEVFGDYGAGPNHVLPTAGAARFTGGLGVASFLRRQTVTTLTAAAASALAEPTARLAEAEGLAAHARAARLRAL